MRRRDPIARLRRRAAEILARAAGAPLTRGDPFRPADAIVVLGATLRPDGRLGRVADERVRVGVALWRRGAAPILCVTGGGPPGRVEADAMAERARALGVPDAALRVERRARSTHDNARFVRDLLAPERCRVVWIVTQPFHQRRAALAFRRAGFEPLSWHDRDSLQYRHPRSALRWIAREYAALAYYAAGRPRAR